MTVRQALVRRERIYQGTAAATVEKDSMRKARQKNYRQRKQGENKEGQVTQRERTVS